jgi:hypothetical protein
MLKNNTTRVDTLSYFQISMEPCLLYLLIFIFFMDYSAVAILSDNVSQIQTTQVNNS